MAALTVVLLLAMLLPSCRPTAADQSSSCRATFPEGSLDLSPLDTMNATGKPRFGSFAVVQISGISYQLSFNPCTGFQCNSDAAAAVCATDVYNIGLRYDVASQTGSSVILSSNGTLRIRYTSVDKTQGRDFVAILSLVCSASSSEDLLTGVNLSESSELTFNLTSRHCCLLPHRPATGWSPGDFIVFFFFLILVLYFVTFLAINWFHLKQSGLDLLPHRHLWANLALLVKDGCVFTFTAARGRVFQRGGYTEIK